MHIDWGEIMETTVQSLNVLSQDSADMCTECLSEHTPDAPHDKDSLFYQCTFHTKYGRWPTWVDAVAHCWYGSDELI